MKLVYHPLCPFSRQVRILLSESSEFSSFSIKKEDYWLRSNDLMKLSPSGELPILITADNFVIKDIYPILEFLIGSNSINHMKAEDNIVMSNFRFIISWFNNKFYKEITKYILDEKMIKFLLKVGYPNASVLRKVNENIKFHLSFLDNLLSQNPFLGTEKIMLPDIVVASHISVLDYFGDINWTKNPRIKDWYMIIKSRPSFRQILKDYVIGIAPSKNYQELDF